MQTYTYFKKRKELILRQEGECYHDPFFVHEEINIDNDY